MNRISTTITVCALLATTAAACSSSKHADGTAVSASSGAGGGTSAGTNSSAGSGTVAPGSSGNGSATGSASSVGATANGAGTTRTTQAIPTTSGPSAPDWLKAHRTELRTLQTAVAAVNAAFQANDDTAKQAALVACANAAAPLARSAAGSLPAAQADAITAIADGCAQMTHDLRSGDTAAVASGKTAFDKAVVVVTPLFP